MHKKKSKKKSKKTKKDSKRCSSTSSENDEQTSRRGDSHKKRRKKHQSRDNDSPSENKRRESSTSEKLLAERSPQQDRPLKAAVYRLEKADSQRQKEKPSHPPTDARPPAAVLHEGANISASKALDTHGADRTSRPERSSSSKSGSGKSSCKSSSEASSSRRAPAIPASSRKASSPTPLPADREKQKRMLVKRRSSPEEKSTPADGKHAKGRISPEQPPPSLAKEPGEKRSRLGRRTSPEEAQRTGKDQEGRQRAVSLLQTTRQSSATTMDESSETQDSKPAVSKHIAELSDTAKPPVEQHVNTSNTKPKLPLMFTIPKKTKPITARTGIWDDDERKDDSEQKRTTEEARPTQSKAEFGSKLMVPRKIRIGPMDRSSAIIKTKQTSGTAPEASVSTSRTPPSPPLQKHEEEKSSVLSSSVVTDASSSEPAETHDTDHEMQLVEELHLARSERRLEVNVEEIYGELTCMDIDPPEEGASNTQNKQLVQQELIVVLDTNILLSHLDFVKKMVSHGLGGLGFPTVLVPWVVLQELDSLKNGKRLSSSVAHLATPAVHYIYTCLKSQEPRLWGQSMQQASQSSLNLKAENNDDRVLQCCLQYQSLYPDGALVLCTNDKNLCSKSLLSGVRALSKVDLVKEMEKATPVLLSPLHPQTPAPAPMHSHTQTLTLKEASSLTQTPQSSFQRTSLSPRPAGKDEGRISEGHQSARSDEKEKRKEVEEGRRRRCAAKEARELSVCVSALEDCLKGVLSQILEVEMKAAYEDLWTEVVYIKPPWTLADLLQCFRKHWIAVFGNIVPRSLLLSVENLCDFLRSGKTVKLSSATVAVSEARELLQSFSCRPVYSECVSPALSSLDLLQQRLHALLEKAPEERPACDSDTLMAEEEQGEKASVSPHEEVWSLFELIWTNVCQISSVVFTALRFDPAATATSQLVVGGPPPPLEALSCLQRLLSTVTQLLQGFSRVLSPDSGLEDSQALLSFIVSSQIAAVEPRCNARQLQDCLSLQEYREKLFMGGSQMAELRASLERCVEAVAHRTIITPWL